ncbi:RNA-binding protein [Celeribacter litoreus]|uniref:RNA-binding protein n=1 Tax=Celeribacter litoreus TaxID=2876714 RepID=UPI001CCAAA26|nr:RNA-binding protein [Celeribacter litoreus]MCA0042104.1 RNA-binding protein [Celeribacter litoreus]
MSRGGMVKTKDEAERRCIVSREAQPKRGLIRFVIAPDGLVVPDLAEKLPGRGIWVAADRAALDEAVKKNLFSKAARTKVIVPDNFVDLIEAGMADRVVHLISLARKAGQAVCGFEKVKNWLADGHAKILLQASDGSERGKGKLWTPEGGRWFGHLTSSELGLAFGRESVIHGALAGGGLSKRVVEDANRLMGVRETIGGEGSTGKGKTTK